MNTISYVLLIAFLYMCCYLVWFWFCFGSCVKKRQKTHSQQQRRMYAGSRARPSLSQNEPTVYVSPSNFPPPPKYEAMAPPSYEEVVGIHYPNYSIQPITQPIITNVAQTSDVNRNNTTESSSSRNNTETNTRNDVPTTVITVTSENRVTSVTATTA